VQQARQLSYVQQAIHSLIDEADLLLGEIEEQGAPSPLPLVAPPPSLELYQPVPRQSGMIPCRSSLQSAITSLIAEGEEMVSQLTPKHRQGVPHVDHLVVDQLLIDVGEHSCNGLGTVMEE